MFFVFPERDEAVAARHGGGREVDLCQADEAPPRRGLHGAGEAGGQGGRPQEHRHGHTGPRQRGGHPRASVRGQQR